MELMFRSLMHGTGIWTAATNWMNMSRERLFRGAANTSLKKLKIISILI
jgi:hypothetical protein